jgi:protein transport protein SEC61 subunit gamma-like protein
MTLELDLEKSFRDMYNTLKLAKKGGWEEYKIHLKLVLLGLGVVGALGFIIQFISALISYSGG